MVTRLCRFAWNTNINSARIIKIFIRRKSSAISLWHSCCHVGTIHDDVIKWKHFPRYWPFVWGIHRSPVNSPHRGRWCGALMFSWICAWINGWVNNGEAVDLRRHRAHYDVTVMFTKLFTKLTTSDLGFSWGLTKCRSYRFPSCWNTCVYFACFDAAVLQWHMPKMELIQARFK